MARTSSDVSWSDIMQKDLRDMLSAEKKRREEFRRHLLKDDLARMRVDKKSRPTRSKRRNIVDESIGRAAIPIDENLVFVPRLWLKTTRHLLRTDIYDIIRNYCRKI